MIEVGWNAPELTSGPCKTASEALFYEFLSELCELKCLKLPFQKSFGYCDENLTVLNMYCSFVFRAIFCRSVGCIQKTL